MIDLKKNKNVGNHNVWRRILGLFLYSVKIIMLVALLGILFTGGVAAGFLASKVQDEPVRDFNTINDRLHTYNQTGEAYFGNGELIGYLRTSLSSHPVQIEEVSPHIIDALLAVEDNEFYSHFGINVKGLSRAVIEYWQTSGQGTGGSTITQQLVKNQFLGSERKFERKFKEMLLAMRVERMFDKDRILESYLNIIYLGYNTDGKNIEGVQAAAKGIFNVDAKDLNIPQSAFIMGMIHRPGYYTPFNRDGSIHDQRLERGLGRMSFVLGRMLETNRITVAQYHDALEYDIRGNLAKPTANIVDKYPFLTFEIESQAIAILANHNMKLDDMDPHSLSTEIKHEYIEQARRQLRLDGYKVYTTIDPKVYEAFHELIKDNALFGPRSKNQTHIYIDPETQEEKEAGYPEQTAAVLIDNQTGAILAMLEGRDFHESQINFATNSPRQPGSSIKPLLDYAPAMDIGVVQPASIIDDTPDFNYNNGKSMSNYADKYYGLVTLREALTKSHNATAYKVFSQMRLKVGESALFSYLQKMGLKHIQEQEMSHNSVSLGGLTQGITVVENTAAYSTFANQGKFREPYMIQRIENNDGQLIYEQNTPSVQVFSEQTAFLMTDMMRNVVDSPDGTARHIRSGLQNAGINLAVAGKTGTTNDEYDYWFVGYTPQVSLGIWLGYERHDSLAPGYSARTQNIWVQLMKKVKEIRPEYVQVDKHFEVPEHIVRKTVCSKSGMLPSDLCQQMGYLVEDYFNEKYVPVLKDDKVVRGRVITFNNEQYIAHASTPDDFVQRRFFIKRDPIIIPEEYRGERYKYFPVDWAHGAPTRLDPRIDNGRMPSIPSGITINQQGQVTWNRVADGDIVGYRVYRAQKGSDFRHIASILNDSSMRYQGTNGPYLYRVTAVDISGSESIPSHIIEMQNQRLEEEAAKEPEEEQQQKDQEQEEPIQEEPIQEEPIQEDVLEENPPQVEEPKEEQPIADEQQPEKKKPEEKKENKENKQEE